MEAGYNPEQEQHYEDLLTSLFVISLRRRQSAISLIQRAVQKTDREEKEQLDHFGRTYAELLEVHLDFVKKKRCLEQDMQNKKAVFDSLMQDIQASQSKALTESQEKLKEHFGGLGIEESKIDTSKFLKL